tara:strand:- start:2 stop:706 length:705 start_codon:yes stop_codon:yes gene_type:complete
MEELPKISILTPTYNRNKFLKLMVFNLMNQAYDKTKLEWCIYDDGTDPMIMNNEEHKKLSNMIKPITLNYYYNKDKKTIGEKRNYLVKKLASNKYCANMDTDDLFVPEWLTYMMKILIDNNKKFAGSPQMLFYFVKQKQYSYINCPSKRQIHECGSVYTKKYFLSMGGYTKSSQGEGAKMIDFNDKNVIETEIQHMLVCLCHDDNTCKKDMFLQNKIEDIGLHEDVLKVIHSIF